jgi:flagellar protein FliL
MVVGLGAGATGAFLVSPLLASRADLPQRLESAVDDDVDTDGPEDAPRARGKRDAYGVIYQVDNLVLNPAGSGGLRFLLVSVAFDLPDDKVEAEARTREPEIRDVLLSVLGSRSVEELADIAGRDSLRTEIRGAVGRILPRGSVRRVYFPQFVIQ